MRKCFRCITRCLRYVLCSTCYRIFYIVLLVGTVPDFTSQCGANPTASQSTASTTVLTTSPDVTLTTLLPSSTKQTIYSSSAEVSSSTFSTVVTRSPSTAATTNYITTTSKKGNTAQTSFTSLRGSMSLTTILIVPSFIKSSSSQREAAWTPSLHNAFSSISSADGKIHMTSSSIMSARSMIIMQSRASIINMSRGMKTTKV